MKKLLFVALILILLCPALLIQAEEAPIRVMVDNEELQFDVPPMLINDRTMVPLRVIFETLGAEVGYEDATRLITATRFDATVKLTVDSNVMYVNDTAVTLDVPATEINGRTLVPVRAISEAFGCDVAWEEETNTVWISSAKTGDTTKVLQLSEAPIVDFANDDGLKSKLHYDTRLVFEQKVFPSMLFDNPDVFAGLLLDAPDDAYLIIDEHIWLPCMDNALATYLLETEPGFEKLDNDAAIQKIDALADQYELWPHQNYATDIFKLNDTDICMLLSMADIGEKVVMNDLDKMLISAYVAVVYESDTQNLRYFCLKKSLMDAYMLCGYDKDLNHLNFGTCEKNSTAFITAISEIIK